MKLKMTNISFSGVLCSADYSLRGKLLDSFSCSYEISQYCSFLFPKREAMAMDYGWKMVIEQCECP
jgi:hypothetical protein